MTDYHWWLGMLLASAKSMILVVEIVIPLMVAIELFKYWNVIVRITPFFRPLLRPLRLPNEALFPLVAGLLFGMMYGAGIIIQSDREGLVTKKDLFTVLLFLVICHSLIEDTMLFVAVGASFWILTITRLVMAFAVTYAWVRFSARNEEKPQADNPRIES